MKISIHKIFRNHADTDTQSEWYTEYISLLIEHISNVCEQHR